ncbi:MAG TPA: glycosyltransferase family 1 protein [bacterium]|nr:glycosyltransferase family 1 protein [bacterium]
MNIVIDVRCLNEYPLTGVPTYAIAVLNNLFSLDKTNNYLLFNNTYYSENENLKFLIAQWTKNQNVRYFNLHWPNKILNFLLKFKLVCLDKILSRRNIIEKIDCWWSPNMNYLNLSSNIKLLLTVHDLSFHLFPDFYSFKERLWHWGIGYKKLFQRANRLLSVSQSTAHDLQSLGIPVEKIKVLPLGVETSVFYKIVDENKLSDFKQKYNLPERFFIFVATLGARKNLKLLIEAWLGLPATARRACRLLLIGKKTAYWETLSRDRWGGGRRNYDQLWGDVGIRIFSDATPGDLPYFYNLAEVLVYPSCYEGFGLPPLEALACACPVIVGGNSALLENFSEAITIDVDNPDELQDLLFAFVHGKINKELAFPKSFNVEKYSWKNYAENLLNLMESL